MKIQSIRDQIIKYKSEGKSVFTTSSFQTHSLVLLHILSRIDNTIPIYFLNTGYHFPETLAFRDQIADMFGIKIIDINSFIPKRQQRDGQGRLLFTSDPDYCCFLNKIQPMDSILLKHDVWVSGVRRDQNANRKRLNIEEPASHNTLRYHPMLEWDSKMIYQYRKEYNIPEHPLEQQGYLSIGCEPCTRKYVDEGRQGRWFGLNKSECGLNTDLLNKTEPEGK